MADCGRVWSDEVQCLLTLWSDVVTQCELLSTYRKAPVWKELVEELKKRNFDRTPAQVDFLKFLLTPTTYRSFEKQRIPPLPV